LALFPHAAALQNMRGHEWEQLLGAVEASVFEVYALDLVAPTTQVRCTARHAVS
jgi:hypothetical protein